MLNFNEHIADNKNHFHSLSYGDSLFTVYRCGIPEKFIDIWSHNNYIVYVAGGKKVWHTAHGSYSLQEGDCVFIRRGAAIVEQFFDTEFCLYIFFVSDQFICDVLKSKTKALYPSEKKAKPIIEIETNEAIHSFFKSMLPYFNAPQSPDPTLLELKFRELILTLADNRTNEELLCYFHCLMHAPKNVSLQMVMEDNFCFNLKMSDFARLNYRSLSAFKRDFEQVYNTSPGKWLMEKRLNHAKHLLVNVGKSVSDAAFESGFESIPHFSRAFSNRFGIPPSAVKKSINSLG